MRHSRLKSDRSGGLSYIAAAVLLLGWPALAQRTTVAQSGIGVAGSLATGKIVITPQPAFTALDGTYVAGSVTVNVVNGAFSVALEPNDTGSPALSAYTAQWQLVGSRPGQETWVIPTSATALNLSAVKVTGTPPYNYTITLGQLAQSGAAVGQGPCWNGTAYLPGFCASGPIGPTGAASTVAGPIGPTGAVSTAPGPVGPTGAVSTVAGPIGPTGAVSTVPGPVGPTGIGNVSGTPAVTTTGPLGSLPYWNSAGSNLDLDNAIIYARGAGLMRAWHSETNAALNLALTSQPSNIFTFNGTSTTATSTGTALVTFITGTGLTYDDADGVLVIGPAPGANWIPGNYRCVNLTAAIDGDASDTCTFDRNPTNGSATTALTNAIYLKGQPSAACQGDSMLPVWCLPLLQRLFLQYGSSGGTFELANSAGTNAGTATYPIPGFSVLAEGVWASNAPASPSDASPAGLTASSSDGTTTSTECDANGPAGGVVEPGGCITLAGSWLAAAIFYVQSPTGGSFRWRQNSIFGAGTWATVSTAGTQGINFINTISTLSVAYSTLQINVVSGSGTVTLTDIDCRTQTPGIHAIVLGHSGGTSQGIAQVASAGYIKHMQNFQADLYLESWGGNEGGAGLSPGLNMPLAPSGGATVSTNPQTTFATFGVGGLSATSSLSTITPTGWTLSTNDPGSIITLTGCGAGTYYITGPAVGGAWPVADNTGNGGTPGTCASLAGTISAGMVGYLTTLDARIVQANPNADLFLLPEYAFGSPRSVSDYSYEQAEETWARQGACNPSSGVGCALLKSSLLVGPYPQGQARGLFTNNVHLGGSAASMWAAAIAAFLNLGDHLPLTQSALAAAISGNAIGGGAFVKNLLGTGNVIYGPNSSGSYIYANQNTSVGAFTQLNGSPNAVGNALFGYAIAENSQVNYLTCIGWEACQGVFTGNSFSAAMGGQAFSNANSLGTYAGELAGAGYQVGCGVTASGIYSLLGYKAGCGTYPFVLDRAIASVGSSTGKAASGLPALVQAGSWGDNSVVRHSYSLVCGMLVAGSQAQVCYHADPVLVNTTAYTLSADESGAICTNPGAAGTVICTLPACAATAVGLTYSLYEAAPTASGYTLELLTAAASGDKISLGPTMGAANGNLQTTTFGNTARLVCIGLNNWAAVAYNPTTGWTVN